MSREESFIRMLGAASKMQLNISVILEAKAMEAEKIRAWFQHHFHPQSITTHEDLVKKPIEVHEHLLEVIDGLTKMEYALAKNLKTLLNPDEGEESSGFDFGGGSDFSSFMDSGGEKD